MQQTKCKECKRQQFLSEAQTLRLKNLTGRARFYDKQAATVTQQIIDAPRLVLLHACSPEHKAAMQQLRKLKAEASKAEIYSREQKLLNARRLLEGCISALAEAMLQSPDRETDPNVARLEAKVRHYKVLVAQRQRRLGEAKHGC